MNKGQNFDPDNNFQLAQGIFGLPADLKKKGIVLVPVPWEVSVSYGAGTANAPDAIYKASSQIDLYDDFAPDEWNKGIFLSNEIAGVEDANAVCRSLASKIISFLEEHGNAKLPEDLNNALHEINTQSEIIHTKIQTTCEKIMAENQSLIGIIGGDHSCSLGLINALANIHDSFGILQIDAHADLRDAYEGFQYSHASAMRNALNNNSISSLTQVSVRDYCAAENAFIKSHKERIHCFTQDIISAELFSGKSWQQICHRIIDSLPEKVYISFDIDGLDPSLCPSTGTPVPGGLSFYEAVHIIRRIVDSKRTIIGFDLCEVSPSKGEGDSWDAIVGARVLYQLCINALKSQH